MAKFASNKYAYGISDRSGQRYRLKDMRLEWTNRATNMADANRYLRSWTKSLRESLDQARAQQ